jgi:cytoskeletal protein CcmA (bactofilin family)
MKSWRKSEQITGFLDRGTSVTGELQFSNTLRIDGSFHGSIAGDDALIIGEHAVVHADIKVGEIEIHGQVFGNVTVKRRAEICPTGRLRGDLQTPVLVVHVGAVLDGRSSMPPAATSEAPRAREETRIAGSSDQKDGIDLGKERER